MTILNMILMKGYTLIVLTQKMLKTKLMYVHYILPCPEFLHLLLYLVGCFIELIMIDSTTIAVEMANFN